MSLPAFIPTAHTVAAPTRALPRSRFLSRPRRTSVRTLPCHARRARVQASAEMGEKPPAPEATSSDPDAPTSPPPTAPFEAPSLDTEVFSNFVDSAQVKVDEFTQQVQNVDTEVLLEDAKEASVGLVDNLLAGDWLNRGELYGALQLVFVILLLRSPGGLDGLITFLCGPVILLAGGTIAGKSLWDLGRKQLSIWPAPVPSAELKTEGMYEYVRHPMYSGLILASAGYAVSTGSPARFAITLAFAAFLVKKIDIEEKFLADTYPEYATYSDKVTSKIFPGIF